MTRYSFTLVTAVLSGLLAILLAACSQGGDGSGLGSGRSVPASFAELSETGGELVVLTLEGPTSYYESEGEATGYEVELAEAFAREHDLEIRFVVKRNIDTLFEALNNREGHIGAAGLTSTPGRRERIEFGPAYKNVRQQLVCHDDSDQPRRLEQLANVRIAVVAGSSYAETMEEIGVEHPEIGWTAREVGSAMPLLTGVDRGSIDCTIADSNLVAYARRRHPELAIPMSLTEDQPLAWAVAPGVEGLHEALADWFAQSHDNDLLQALDERWYGHFDEFDYIDVVRFIERLDERLPRFRSYFERAAQEMPFDWTLLAAQAYQESHWDPDARSPTGVEGLMMLTMSTAARVGVENRRDPRQSVQGGAAYLADLYERIPDGVQGEDRLWFALGAYNVGLGHVYDARALAERRGLNKNDWDDVAEVLPLLSQPEFYQQARHGYCRGHEPVHYVRKIREYYAMLHANLEL